jgi:hypothetical protein
MNLYVGTLGELIIVEAFVFTIWVRVLLDAIAIKNASVSARKLLLTSYGLVFNAFAIGGIMLVRAIQLSISGSPNNTFIWPITVLYAILAVGNILFIISAAIGQKPQIIKMFILLSLTWCGICVYLSYFH